MKNFKKIFLALTAFSLCFSMAQTVALADQSSASLSLGGGSYAVGSTFQDVIYEDSGTDPVNVVKTDLSYNPAELELVSIDTSSSAFANPLKASGSNGSISIIRYDFNKVQGRAIVAVLNFKNLSGTSSKVDFAGTSQVISAANNKNIYTDGNSSSGNYNFTIPVAVASTTTPASAQTAKQSTAKTTAQPVSTLATEDKVAQVKALPKPVVAAPTVADTNSQAVELLVTFSSLLYLGALGWVVRSKHPAAARIRAIRRPKLHQIRHTLRRPKTIGL